MSSKPSKTRTASEALADDSAKKARSNANAGGFGLGDAVVTRSGFGGLEKPLRFYVSGVCCDTGTVSVHLAGSTVQLEFRAGDLVLLRDAEAQAAKEPLTRVSQTQLQAAQKDSPAQAQQNKSDDAYDSKSDSSDSQSESDALDADYEDEEEDEAVLDKDKAEEAAVVAGVQAELEMKVTSASRIRDLLKCHPESLQKVRFQVLRRHLDGDSAKEEPQEWMFSVAELKEQFGITLEQFYKADRNDLDKWICQQEDDFPNQEGWMEHEEFMAAHEASPDYIIGQNDGEIVVAYRCITTFEGPVL
jgi:hypothetical protein